MISGQEIIVPIFLSYYWTGYEMVMYHSLSSPMDQPMYVRGPFWGKMGAGSIWPYVCYRNRELYWFVVTFVASIIVIMPMYIHLFKIISSVFLTVSVIGILRILPIISNILSLIMAFICAILWQIIAAPFGAKIPSAIERMNKRNRF